MIKIKRAEYTCDWCEGEESFEGEDPYTEAAEEGWIVMTIYPEENLTFCGKGCLVAYF